MTPTRLRFLAAALVCAALAASCHSGRATGAGPTTVAPPSSVRPARTTTSSAPCSDASIVATWPLSRRAEQLLVLPALNGEIDPLDPLIAAGPGGVVLLGASMASDLGRQIATARQRNAIAPLVMADEEGGGIQRLAGLVGSLPWPRQMAATMSPDQVRSAAEGVAVRMSALGVTVDLAPVLDVDGGVGPSSSNPDGLRAFSADPARAATYGVAFLDGLRRGGVIPVVKHFPGLGGSSANTDYGAASTLPISVLRTQALPPFQAAIAAGVPAVMVANATVPGLSAAPASVSPAVVGSLLRGQMGFAGLVLTDSVSAGAIGAAGYSVPGAAVAAVEAGADLVLWGSTLTAAQMALLSPANVASTAAGIVAALANAVATGNLGEGRLDDAVLHVLAVKGVHLCRR